MPLGECRRLGGGGEESEYEETGGSVSFFLLSAAKPDKRSDLEARGSGLSQTRGGCLGLKVGSSSSACRARLLSLGSLGPRVPACGADPTQGVCAVKGGVFFSRWSSTPSCGPKLRMGNGIGERSSRGRRLVIFATSRWVLLRPCTCLLPAALGRLPHPLALPPLFLHGFFCAVMTPGVMRDRNQRLRFCLPTCPRYIALFVRSAIAVDAAFTFTTGRATCSMGYSRRGMDVTPTLPTRADCRLLPRMTLNMSGRTCWSKKKKYAWPIERILDFNATRVLCRGVLQRRACAKRRWAGNLILFALVYCNFPRSFSFWERSPCHATLSTCRRHDTCCSCPVWP